MKPFGTLKRVNILFSTMIFLSFNSNINVMGNSFRKLSVDYLTNVKCDSLINNTCVCPGKCMQYSNSTGDCILNKCYGWDDMNNLCINTGKSYNTAIILTAIPVTGGIGIGQMVMGRWDMVSIIWGPILGAILISCFIPCVCKCLKASDDTIEECGICMSTIFTGLLGCNSLVVWIIFIVLVATKKMLDGNGCELV